MPLKKLSELIPGQRGKIMKISGSGPLRQRMIDMGLVTASEIEVIRCAPLGDPVEYQVKGYNLSLRKHEAERILVEVNSFPLKTFHQSSPVRLTQICGGRHLKRRVQELGLQIGSVLYIRENKHRGPVIVEMDNRRLEIGQGMAQKILIEPIV